MTTARALEGQKNARTSWPPRVSSAPRPQSFDVALVLEDITQTFGSARIIDGLSLTIGRGEIVALVGHSGSGKSTLLRIIAGLERPQRGIVSIGGRQMFGPDRIVPTEKRGVGMMFQDYALFPHLTVLANVAFGVRDLTPKEAHERAAAALERVGLASRARDYPHALSGGEQQRVALVRALIPQPRVLLMDEPFSNLDRRNRDTIRDQTARILRDSGTTVVIVTHEPEDAMRMTDRTMLLQGGRIIQGGPAEELYRNPASLLVARFFSEFNEIAGVNQGGMVDTAIGRFTAPSGADGDHVVVCVRPHDINVGEGIGNDTLRGTVVSRSFVGDEQMLALWVPGLAAPLHARAPVHADVEVGETIEFHLRADEALVFPEPK